MGKLDGSVNHEYLVSGEQCLSIASRSMSMMIIYRINIISLTAIL